MWFLLKNLHFTAQNCDLLLGQEQLLYSPAPQVFNVLFGCFSELEENPWDNW